MIRNSNDYEFDGLSEAVSDEDDYFIIRVPKKVAKKAGLGNDFGVTYVTGSVEKLQKFIEQGSDKAEYELDGSQVGYILIAF